MTLRIRITKKRALLALPFVVLATAVGAWALVGWFWQPMSGNGRGATAAAASPTIDTFDVQPSTATACLPGKTCDMTLYVSNPNSFPVYVENVDVDASSPVPCTMPDSGSGLCTPPNTGCTRTVDGTTTGTPNFAWNTAVLTKDAFYGDPAPQTYEFTTPIQVAANATHVPITMPNVISMASTSPVACAGVAIGPNENTLKVGIQATP